MSKNIIAVMLAPIVWGIVGLSGNQLIFIFFPGAPSGEISNGYLFTSLIASFIYSAIAGAVAAWVADSGYQRIGLHAGIALLAVGITMQVAFWDTLPQWYHLAFLFWLIPLCMVGANLVRARQSS